MSNAEIVSRERLLEDVRRRKAEGRRLAESSDASSYNFPEIWYVYDNGELFYATQSRGFEHGKVRGIFYGEEEAKQAASEMNAKRDRGETVNTGLNESVNIDGPTRFGDFRLMVFGPKEDIDKAYMVVIDQHVIGKSKGPKGYFREKLVPYKDSWQPHYIAYYKVLSPVEASSLDEAKAWAKRAEDFLATAEPVSPQGKQSKILDNNVYVIDLSTGKAVIGKATVGGVPVDAEKDGNEFIFSSLEESVEQSEKRIKTVYEIITPESAEEGDAEERGWEDEEGELIEPWDTEAGQTVVEAAIEWLETKGPFEASQSKFSPGVWYTHYGGQDYDGSYTNYSYHLVGFTPEEEQQIYDGLKAERLV